MIKGKKKAPVCFTGFKVLLCVQLPCVTTCRLRARFSPSPLVTLLFLNIHFAYLEFESSSVSQLTRNFLGLWYTEVEWIHILKGNKKTARIWIFNLEATLTWKYLLKVVIAFLLPFHIPQASMFREAKKRMYPISVFVQRFLSLTSKWNNATFHFDFPTEISLMIWLEV